MFPQLVTPVCAAAWGPECISNGDVATIGGISCLLQNLLSFFPPVIALAAVGMIIFAGTRFMSTDPGDAKSLAAAWSTITWAVIGLVLLIVVWFALYLVEQFTGAPVTQFQIGT